MNKGYLVTRPTEDGMSDYDTLEPVRPADGYAPMWIEHSTINYGHMADVVGMRLGLDLGQRILLKTFLHGYFRTELGI